MIRMTSKEGSPASQSKLILASEAEETITPVSHPIGLTELTASLEVLNTKVDKRSTIVHRTQTSFSSGANKIPGTQTQGIKRRLHLPQFISQGGMPSRCG